MTPRVPVLVIVLVLVLVAVGCSSGGDTRSSEGSSTTSSSTLRTPEPVRRHVVSLSSGVSAPQNPIWSHDGKLLVFSGRPAGSDGVDVFSVHEDGTGLKCLTCAATGRGGKHLLKPFPFSDGRRVLLRTGEQSPVAPADHSVLECRPSVSDCRHASILPIDPPDATDPGVVQDQREYRIAPDGHTVALSQIRTRPDGSSAFAAIVGQLERHGDHYEVADPRVVSALGELKNFTPDGQGVLVAGFTTLPDRAADPDDVRVDLRTGRVTQVTLDGDYDEDIDLSPDQRWYVVGSGRAAELFDTVSQVRRPNFLGPGLEPLTGYLFAKHRADLLEPWLVRVGAEAAGGRGQQLNPTSAGTGYDARVPMSWSPSGDAITYWEASNDPFQPPTTASRIVVDHLTARRAVPIPAPRRSPEPSWAPSLRGYRSPAFPLQRSRAGRRGGRATVTSTIRAGRITIDVRYDHFTDDGEWVVTGTESATSAGGLFGGSSYTADLALSGAHHGSLRADAPQLGAAGMTGSIVSDVDGHVLRLPREAPR